MCHEQCIECLLFIRENTRQRRQTKAFTNSGIALADYEICQKKRNSALQKAHYRIAVADFGKIAFADLLGDKRSYRGFDTVAKKP